MIVELVSVAALLLGGSALLRAAGLTGWVVPALGLVVGVSLQIAVTLLLVVVGLPSGPIVSLAVTLLAPAVVFAVAWQRGRVTLPSWRRLALAGLALVAVVAVLRNANLVAYHWDTLRYLTTGSLLESGQLDRADVPLLEARLLAVPVLHASANLQEELYLRSITPLLGAATLAVLVWIVHEGTRGVIGTREAWWFGGAAGLLLATTNRFVFNSFYLNGHLLVAVLVLLLAAAPWLVVRADRRHQSALFVAQLLALPALVVSRPETSLLAALAVLPYVLSSRFAWWRRASVAAVLGGSIIAWYAFLLREQRAWDRELDPSFLAMVGLGVAIVAAAGLVRSATLLRWRAATLVAVEVVLWLLLAVFTLRDPELFWESAVAAARNGLLGAQSWGAILGFLALLVLGVWVFTRGTEAILLRFPLTTFVPLSFIAAFLRESPYRINPADSLNRMLLHIVPLAIAYVAASAAAEEWSAPWQRARSRLDRAQVRADGSSGPTTPSRAG